MTLWAELPRNHVDEPNTVRANRHMCMRQPGRWLDHVHPSFSTEVENKDLVVDDGNVLVASNNVEPIADFGAGSIEQCAGAFWARRPITRNNRLAIRTQMGKIKALYYSRTPSTRNQPRGWSRLVKLGQ